MRRVRNAERYSTMRAERDEDRKENADAEAYPSGQSALSRPNPCGMSRFECSPHRSA